jgi:hypothetical protein
MLFVEVKEKGVAEIKSIKWVHALAFSVDITRHLSGSNLHLQGERNMLYIHRTVEKFLNQVLAWGNSNEEPLFVVTKICKH